MNELIDTTDLTDKEYLSVSEVRQTLGISENTLYRYLRKGHFSPIKYKNKNYFRSREIKSYLSDVFGEQVQ